MFDTAAPRIFGQPMGCDYPLAVVAGLRARLQGQPPEAMAKVTLYVNTNRMQARILDILAAGDASFLPRIRLVTQLGDDIDPDLPKPANPLRRMLDIANLVSALLNRQPDLAPRSALFDLSASLASLLDEMHSEGVAPSTIAALDVAQHSAHWDRAQAFLRIVTPLFENDPGPEGRRRAAVLALMQRWKIAPPHDPVIVAGTTGSRRATAELMQAVSRLPQGAIILPGYDFDLPHDVWRQMDDVLAFEDHPQFRFRRLMDRIGFAPSDVQVWHDIAPQSPARNALVSLSLRPAPVTDQWLRDGPNLGDLALASGGMTLIEAQTQRAEAMAIALILREAAQNQQRAALITPDRNLSRQVTAALDRWGIVPDDSAGRPLALSAAGRFMRHTAALMVEALSLDRLITLLKHPLTGAGEARGVHLLLVRELELHLRRHGPAFPDLAMVQDWAARQPFAGASDWALALAPLFAARAGDDAQPLATHVAKHLALSLALVRATDETGASPLWQSEAGAQMQRLMSELAEVAGAAPALTATDYRQLFEQIIQNRPLRNAQIAHPDILIWGTIEARVQGCDLVILGGLNDGTWPKSPVPDPWLNRQMRKDAALLLPDRQIGLSAHDYQQAIAAQRVVLTRAQRSEGSETVPSRWLNRLTNLMQGLGGQNGPQMLEAMRGRGRVWLDMARAIDLPAAFVAPAPRPAPAPPPDARPRSLPVTAMEHLIVNPYHVYARHVLNLRPLPPLRATADARDRGTAVHLILERFVKSRPETESLDAARARLTAITRDVLAAEVPFPAMRILWQEKLMRVIDSFLSEDRRWGGTALAVETRGRLTLDPLDFALTATPDRIDRLPDGRLHIIDYKTGSAPTEAEQAQHRKQLLFTAVMAQQGGFAELGPSDVARISYISLAPSGKSVHSDLTPDRITAEAQILQRLVAAYLQPDIGFTARRADYPTRFEGDYDHLMRYGEWLTSDPAVVIAVGNGGEI